MFSVSHEHDGAGGIRIGYSEGGRFRVELWLSGRGIVGVSKAASHFVCRRSPRRFRVLWHSLARDFGAQIRANFAAFCRLLPPFVAFCRFAPRRATSRRVSCPKAGRARFLYRLCPPFLGISRLFPLRTEEI